MDASQPQNQRAQHFDEPVIPDSPSAVGVSAPGAPTPLAAGSSSPALAATAPPAKRKPTKLFRPPHQRVIDAHKPDHGGQGSIPAILFEERLALVYRMVNEGHTEAHIRQVCSEAWSTPTPDPADPTKLIPPKYPCGWYSITRYITRARARIAVESNFPIDYIRTACIAHQWQVIRDPKSDPKRVDAAFKELGKIYAIYSPQRIAVTDTAGNDLPVTSEMRERLLASDLGRTALMQLADAAAATLHMRGVGVLGSGESAGQPGGGAPAEAATVLNGHSNGHAGNGHHNGNGHH